VSFQNSLFFLLFIFLGGAIVVYLRKTLRKRSRLFYPTDSWIQGRPRFQFPSPARIHLIFRVVALSFLIVALARPQDVFTKEKKLSEAVDIMISFDLSKSMDAVDFKPNRRTVAIKVISDFIRSRSEDRIGLVFFSGEAYLGVPLTTDHEVLIQRIEESSNRHIKDGTAIGESVAVAVNYLKNSKARSRVILLVTDGDNNMGSVDPETAAELAQGYGLRIYTVAIGKKGIVDFPVTIYDPIRGQQTVWQQLTDAINEPLLESMATRTGGRFFRAQDKDVLARIFDTIDQLEKTKVETQTLVRYSEKAWPWIFAGFFLLLIEGLALNTRWRKLP
jgi:Ca-activated chloride channel homolog